MSRNRYCELFRKTKRNRMPIMSEEKLKTIADQIRRVSECPICLTLLTSVSSFCPFGHPVCETCLIMLSNTTIDPKCPMCRTEMIPEIIVSSTALKLVELMSSIKIPCSNRQYGCNQLLIMEEVVKHETLHCPYLPNSQCMLPLCHWVGFYDQLFQHVKHAHPDVIIDTTVSKYN